MQGEKSPVDQMDEFDRQLGAEKKRAINTPVNPIRKQPSATASQASVTSGIRHSGAQRQPTPSGTSAESSQSSVATNSVGVSTLNLLGNLEPEVIAALSNPHVSRQMKMDIARLVLHHSGASVPNLTEEVANKIVAALAAELSAMQQPRGSGTPTGQRQPHSPSSLRGTPSSATRGGGFVFGGSPPPIGDGSITPVAAAATASASGRATVEIELMWSEGREVPAGTRFERPSAPTEGLPPTPPFNPALVSVSGEGAIVEGSAASGSVGSSRAGLGTVKHTSGTQTPVGIASGAQGSTSSKIGTGGGGGCDTVAAAPIRPRPTIATKSGKVIHLNPNLPLVVQQNLVAGLVRRTEGSSSVARSASSAFSECSTSSYGSRHESIVSQGTNGERKDRKSGFKK